VSFEYGAMNTRTEIRGQVNRQQRERIAELMAREIDANGLLKKEDRDELTGLQQLAGVAPDAPLDLVRKWAAGELSATPNTIQRSMGMTATPRRDRSGRSAQLATLAARWPAPRLTPRQKIVELYRMRGEWYLTPRQIQLQRMKERWT
jgi:hypothetical protein